MGNKCPSCVLGCHKGIEGDVAVIDFKASIQSYCDEQSLEKRKNASACSPSAGVLYRAMYDFTARTSEDMSFARGDIIAITDRSDGSWWYGVSHVSKQRGFVPSNYIEEYDSLSSRDWFFGNLKRSAAERLLLRLGLPGAFLIRKSESNPGDYSLSLRDADAIKHFRVRKLDAGGFYITTRTKFADLDALVGHYTRKADGLPMKLGRACPRPEQFPTLMTLSHDDPWEVPRDRIHLIRRLGQGHFGEVWQATWNDTIPVAVKTLKSGLSSSREEFLREVAVMKKISHPHLVQLYCVCSLGDPVLIVLELMKHGSLRDHLCSSAGAGLSLADLVDMATQVATGMAYLETNRLVHRDLAARNVLVNENAIVKIADFGLSKFLTGHDVGTGPNALQPAADDGKTFAIKWTAPEALIERRFTIKSDVWSFGILMYEIVTKGRQPYAGIPKEDVLDLIVGKDYRMPRPTECPSEFYDIMLSCWHRRPERRPTFETLQWTLSDYFYNDDCLYMDASLLSTVK